MIVLKKIGWRVMLAALAVFSVLAVPAAGQYNIYDLGPEVTVTTQDIKADNNNNVHLIWVNYGVLYYGRIVNNALSGKVEVARDVDTIFWRPYLSVSPDGSSVHITWSTGGISMGNTMKHAWRNSAGSWSVETIYQAPANRNITLSTCAVDGAGQVHVLFVIYQSSPSEWATIFYMRKLAGGGWEPVKSFAPLDPEHKYPMLFTDSTGRVHKYKNLLFPRRGEFPPLALNPPSYPCRYYIAGRAAMSIALNSGARRAYGVTGIFRPGIDTRPRGFSYRT